MAEYQRESTMSVVQDCKSSISHLNLIIILHLSVGLQSLNNSQVLYSTRFSFLFDFLISIQPTKDQDQKRFKRKRRRYLETKSVKMRTRRIATIKSVNVFALKRRSSKTMSSPKYSILKPLTLCVAILQLTSHVLQANAYNNNQHHHYQQQQQQQQQPGSPYYDPEHQVSGIAPAIQWQYDDQQDEDSHPVPVSHRRVSDSDLEDGLEEEDDEDRDDYARSGSINHGRYVEDPSFGESDRAAKDGEDIESFFDKHLGPQAAMESNSDEDHEVPIPSSSKAEADHYEAAASSPLSNIFHSLLNAHKRPFIIHTTEEDPNSPSTSSGDNQQSTSSSAPIGSSIRGNSQATTYAAVPGGYAAPIAYYTPVASPSSAYDQSAAGGNAVQGGNAAEANVGGGGQEEYAPVREIYISRRPTLMGHYQAYAPSSHRLEHQSSNAYWRGSAATGRGVYGTGEDQADYARYPVAASYAYQREQQSALPEEEQTVSFGLSFGSRPSESVEDDGAVDDQGATDESGYEPAYGSREAMLRHSPSMRSYNNYNNYQPKDTQMYGRTPQAAPVMMQQQQQSPYHGARYHKDPSESTTQPINYGQYSGSSSASAPVAKDNRWIVRQHLLANLDNQIKSNPQYRQQSAATTPALQFATNQAVIQRYNPELSLNRNNPVNLRSSQVGVDPYKLYTTTSRVATEPLMQNNNYQRNQIQYNSNNNINRLQTTNSNDKSSTNQLSAAFDGSSKNVAEPRQMQIGSSDGSSTFKDNNNRQNPAVNLLTGPVNVELTSSQQASVSSKTSVKPESVVQINRRVRREDSDDRENEDADDDGVWVDDDEDDDNKQQSSDLNETAQQPESEEDAQQEVASHPGMVRGTHGYELAPDQLMIYPG